MRNTSRQQNRHEIGQRGPKSRNTPGNTDRFLGNFKYKNTFGQLLTNPSLEDMLRTPTRGTPSWISPTPSAIGTPRPRPRGHARSIFLPGTCAACTSRDGSSWGWGQSRASRRGNAREERLRRLGGTPGRPAPVDRSVPTTRRPSAHHTRSMTWNTSREPYRMQRRTARNARLEQGTCVVPLLPQ